MSDTNPADRQYSQDHVWAKQEGDLVLVGITVHAQEVLTEVVFVELPPIGKSVVAGDMLGVVESVKSVSDVIAPLSGTVAEVNSSLESEPAKINTDANGAGWLVKLKGVDQNDFKKLMDSTTYNKFLQEN
jgi:glycine cleavage system H protein